MSSVFNFQSNIFNFIQLHLTNQPAGIGQRNYHYDDDDDDEDEDSDDDEEGEQHIQLLLLLPT